jgi:hypothetical protein
LLARDVFVTGAAISISESTEKKNNQERYLWLSQQF